MTGRCSIEQNETNGTQQREKVDFKKIAKIIESSPDDIHGQ
jgi:hypothetical protein